MEDLANYDVWAESIQSVTSGEYNARIISRIRNQDPYITWLSLFYTNEDGDNYQPMNGRELVWSGYFIGSSNQIQELSIVDNIQEVANITREHIKLFLNGVYKNKSIKKLTLHAFGRRNFQVHDVKQLVKNNSSLVTLILQSCVLDHRAIMLLPLAKTVKTVHFDSMHMNGDRLSDTLAALGMLPLLQTLRLVHTNIGVNECSDIAAFLGRHSTNLTNLDLRYNSIDAEAVEVLVPAISSHTNLRDLDLSGNAGVSARGHRAISALLKSPNCSIAVLFSCSIAVLRLGGSNMDDEGAQLFADTLTNNKSLVGLGLDNNSITAMGWAAFSRLLCDSSSISKTFLSNHTLETLSPLSSVSNMNITQNEELATLLCINEHCDSARQAATLDSSQSFQS